MHVISNDQQKKKFIFLIDIFLVLFAFFLAVSFGKTFFQSFSIGIFLSKFKWTVFLLILLSSVFFYVFELYDHSHWKNNIKLVFYISCAVLVALGIFIVLTYILNSRIIIDRTILFFIIFDICFVFASRKVFEKIFSKSNYLKQKVLLLGNDALINEIESMINRRKSLIPYDLTLIKNYSENPGAVSINGSESSKSLFDMIIENKFNTVVISHRLESLPMLRKQLLEIKFANITIYDSLYFYEALTARAPIHYVNDSWFLFRNQGKKFNPFLYKIVKRAMDIFLSLCGILVLSPLMLLIAVSIKLSSKGHVFFKQERLGLNEQPFTLLKFRTMIENAEKITGPKWADKNDSRITKVGKLLRKTRLDELPQLFNILKGEMGFIGTRPIRKYFAEKLAKDIPHYRLRFLIKPGLTGWAQVQGDYFGSEKGQIEKLEYDLYYIQNQSVFFDFLIMLKTVSAVLFQKGQ